MDDRALNGLQKFVELLIGNLDADELGSILVRSGLNYEELKSFIDTKIPDKPWIYESPDNGKTIYRRPFMSDDRELIEDEGGFLVQENDFNTEGC